MLAHLVVDGQGTHAMLNALMVAAYAYRIWGNVAEWVAGVPTALSSALAIFIIFRDKQRDLMAQAEKLGYSRRTLAPGPDEGSTMSYEIKLHNASDRSLFGVRMIQEFHGVHHVKGGMDAQQWRADMKEAASLGRPVVATHHANSIGSRHRMQIEQIRSLLYYGRSRHLSQSLVKELEPGERVEASRPYVFDGVHPYFYLVYRDASGVRWERNLRTGALRVFKPQTRARALLNPRRVTVAVFCRLRWLGVRRFR